MLQIFLEQFLYRAIQFFFALYSFSMIYVQILIEKAFNIISMVMIFTYVYNTYIFNVDNMKFMINRKSQIETIPYVIFIQDSQLALTKEKFIHLDIPHVESFCLISSINLLYIVLLRRSSRVGSHCLLYTVSISAEKSLRIK